MDQCTHEVRLQYWKNIISQCQARPEGQSAVFCKHFLAKVAKYFWRMLHLQIGESCKASTGSCPASCIAIADQI